MFAGLCDTFIFAKTKGFFCRNKIKELSKTTWPILLLHPLCQYCTLSPTSRVRLHISTHTNTTTDSCNQLGKIPHRNGHEGWKKNSLEPRYIEKSYFPPPLPQPPPPHPTRGHDPEETPSFFSFFFGFCLDFGLMSPSSKFRTSWETSTKICLTACQLKCIVSWDEYFLKVL
jgi:hypothetical protein